MIRKGLPFDYGTDETISNTGRITEMSSKTASTIKLHAGTWSVLGRGKNKQYTIAIKAGTASVGDRFTAKSGAGVVTTGVLVENVRPNTDGVDRFTIDRDKLTPEQRAVNNALRASSTAAYWASDAGVATATKIEARLAKAAAENSTDETPEQVITQVVSQAQGTDLATLIAGFIAAGMDATTAATTALATLAVIPVAQVTTTPAAPVKQRSAKQLANDERLRNRAKGTAATAVVTPAATAQRLPCMACGKQDRLTGHAGEPGLLVCGTCITADTDTVRNRAMKRALKIK